MSGIAARRWLFVVFALTLPLPVLGPFAGSVPPVRHLLLLVVTGAVAAVEGAAGPVPGILALFAAHAAATLLLAWLLAWAAARGLRPLSEGTRRVLVWGVCVALLGAALVFEPYRPPFGRAPTANLLGVLS